MNRASVQSKANMRSNQAIAAGHGHWTGLTRRTFLRGLGASLALPAFESLGALKAVAAGAAPVSAPPPVRAAWVYVPNGTIPAAWWPQAPGSGAQFKLSPTLQPLSGVKEHVQVIGGLADHSAEAGLDGAGDHARAGGTFLTGVRIRKTAGSDLHAGISIDQVIASHIGQLTRFPSLELSCDAVRRSGSCDSGYSCAYGYNLSWRSPTQPVAPEPNPRLVFERFFGAGSPGERAANLKRRQQENRSILDFVMEDARIVQRRLDGRDRQKLDQYLTSVREIEQRISRAEKFPLADPKAETPAGIPQDFAEYVQIMFDMALLAFQTDSTRVATLLLACEGSNRTFPQIGLSEGHHSLSHHRNIPEEMAKVQKIDQWYVGQFARFLEKARDTREADGSSLLDNCVILYGSGNADGNRHTHVDLPILVAGRGGGKLQSGRYLRKDGAPLTNLFLSMADCAGVELPRHGDSTGRLL